MKEKKGFTLVELVIAIVVIAIVMYAVIAIFITSGVKGVNVEVFTVAQSLAEGKLEQKMAMDFGDISNEGWTNFTGDLSGYRYQVAVNYVSAEALDVPVGYSTNFKKVRAIIGHDKLANPTSLESIRANY